MTNKDIIGCGSLSSIGSVIENYSAKKIFLITGTRSFSTLNSIDHFQATLNDFEVCRFSNYESNPKLNDVETGISMFKDFKPDITISIGGGSTIDMGKLVNILAFQSSDNFKEIIQSNSIIKNGGPFIAIPTTAGTGAESTQFAAVFVDGKKFSLSHKYMLPNIAIVDPELTYSMPPYLAACTGMDALSQAVESFWSVGSTKESRVFASEAILTILNSIEDAVCKKSKTAMISMAIASNNSGKAINISKTTAPHALSYGLTQNFKIPHGHAVALTLGKFFTLNSDSKNINENLNLDEHAKVMKELYELFGASTAKQCSEKWYSVMDNIGLEKSFTKLGIINNSEIRALVDNVNIERLENNPVLINRETLIEVFSDN